MGDTDDRPESPPLARGSYNLNFDELDDSIDPFQSRGGLMLSPGDEKSNPFQSKSKMSSSPPIHANSAYSNHGSEQKNDPFKSKNKLGSSPPKQESLPETADNEAVEIDNNKSTPIDIPMDENAFQTRSKIGTSPPVNFDEENAFQTKSKIGQSPPVNFDEENPFQTKSKIGQSPTVNFDEENPFQTKSKIGQSPTVNFDEENPFQTKSKIGQSPTVNFDEENPFQTKSKIGQSPTVNFDEENPFQTKSKIGQSPPSDSGFSESTDNPFQTKTNLGQSPPQSDALIENSENNTLSTEDANGVHNESADSYKTANESHDKNNKGFKMRAKSQTPPSAAILDEQCSTGDDMHGAKKDTKPPQKKSSPKKSGIKKPKAKSKFKPPANFGVQDTGEDVVIFAPPPPNESANQIEPEKIVTGDQPIRDNSDSNSANQMTVSEIVGGVGEMMDSVHDFGASEMLMENNEEFVPAHEAFKEDEAWDMMEQMKSDQLPAPRESLEPFDPLHEQVPDKVTRRASEGVISGNSVEEDEDLMLMNTPPAQKQSTRSVARHPAARALQEEVDGDAPPREAHTVDKMLFSPQRGEDGKPLQEGDERYFDAPEYPHGNRRGPQGDGQVDRMNAANMKQGVDSKDNIVQLVQVLKYSQSDWNKMKQELELDYSARILNKEREWSKKLADRDKKISYLDEQVLLLRSANEDMKCVVTEFEKTIAQLQAEKVKSSTESQHTFEDVIKERDQALEDLQSVETAFSDLHQRYERTKGVVEGFKKNEDTLKKCVHDYQGKLKIAEDKSVSIRQQAEEKLALASDEMDKLRRSTTADVARLEAALKKTELKIQGLERSLDQKVQENSELTAICDELIAKVGD